MIHHLIKMPCLVVFCFNGLREFPLQDVRLCDCFIAGTGAHASASMAWGAPLHTRRVSFVKSQVFKQQVFVTSMGRQGVAKKAKPATSPMGSMNSGQSPRRRRHQCHRCHRWHLWHQHVAPPRKTRGWTQGSRCKSWWWTNFASWRRWWRGWRSIYTWLRRPATVSTHLLTIVVTRSIPVNLRDLKVSQEAYGFKELYSKLAVANDLHSSWTEVGAADLVADAKHSRPFFWIQLHKSQITPKLLESFRTQIWELLWCCAIHFVVCLGFRIEGVDHEELSFSCARC